MKAEGRGFWERTATGVLVVVALLALAGALTSGLERREFGMGSRFGEAAARIMMLFAAGTLGMWVFRRVRNGVTERGVSDDPIYRPDVLGFIELQDAALAQVTKTNVGQYATFVELLVDPARYRSRVVETIDTESNVIRQRVSIEYHLPSGAIGDEPVYLPVMHLPKGTLLDNFDLHDPGGNSLVDLAYEETIKIAAVGLRILLMRVLGTGDGGPEEFLDPRAEKLELVLLGILAQRGRSNPDDAKEAIEEAFESVHFRDLIQMADPADLMRLRRYLLTLGVSHPIVAIVCPDKRTSGRVLLKYEQTIIPSSHTRSRMDPLRLALGLRPRNFQIPLDLSRTAASYHLRVNASSSDQYLYKQALRCRHCKYLVRRSWRGRDAGATGGGCGHVPDGTVGDCHYRLRPRQGQSYLHLYMRGYATLPVPLRDLEVAMQFRETPPGSLASASVTSLAVSALIGVIGYLISVGHDVGNSDLAALILALPAIAASYFGFATDGNSLLRSSLVARLSFIASGLLSIAAAVVYLMRHSGLASATVHPDHGIKIDVAFVTNWAWLILLGLAMVNTLFVISWFVLRLDHYNRLMEKRGSEELYPSYEMG